MAENMFCMQKIPDLIPGISTELIMVVTRGMHHESNIKTSYEFLIVRCLGQLNQYGLIHKLTEIRMDYQETYQ